MYKSSVPTQSVSFSGTLKMASRILCFKRQLSVSLWLVGVTLIFDGTPQITVQRCQIAALRWPNGRIVLSTKKKKFFGKYLVVFFFKHFPKKSIGGHYISHSNKIVRLPRQ